MSARSSNIPVSGLVLQEKMNGLVKKLDIANFKALNGWVDRWKTRNNIKFKTVSGEKKICTLQMTAPWRETHLPTILSKYKLEDIFNADEFGLCFERLPNKTLELKGEKCSGGKHSKARLTGRWVVSDTGKKLPLPVIGRANIRDSSRTSTACHVSTKHNQKSGWTQRFPQTGSKIGSKIPSSEH